MKSLGADVFSNRLPDHQQEVSNFHLTTANEWLRRVDTSPAARGWLRSGTGIAQALSVQVALPRTVSVPIRGTSTIQSKPPIYGFENSSRPHIAVREAEDILAPPSSNNFGTPEHRRSRSHGVLDQRGASEKSGEIPMIYFTRSPNWPAKLGNGIWSQAPGPIGDLLNSKVGQALTSMSPYNNASSALKSPAARTPRKEKRYSMLLARDVSTP
jgi:hypothetical protein